MWEYYCQYACCQRVAVPADKFYIQEFSQGTEYGVLGVLPTR